MTEVGRREQVPEAFDGVAHAYDRLVAVNPGYHAHLRLSARRLVAAAGSTDGAGLRLLDLGCGTGASTAALLAAAPRASIVAVDGSAGMLAEARAKDWPDRVTFHHARAENLVESCVQGPFDGILAAYLVRNLEHRDATLRDLRDLLRRNAPIAVHEYSVADSAVSRLVWAAVCRTVIIPMARVVSGDATLYRYLRRSVVDFDGVRGFEARLRRAGFTDVRTDKVPGWQRGIAHTFLGRRAASAESSPN
ncbi:MAG: class I SAM-dependent methyltransferase, partial [Streptosporangiales bacterium]